MLLHMALSAPEQTADSSRNVANRILLTSIVWDVDLIPAACTTLLVL